MRSVIAFVEHAAGAMNPVLVPCAAICGFLLGAVALSLALSWRARALALRAARDAGAGAERSAAGIAAMEAEVRNLASQIQEMYQPAGPPAGTPRPGLNLNKRSQALRMHRLGETPLDIASALGIPHQEVDLLLKVHRIVISNI